MDNFLFFFQVILSTPVKAPTPWNPPAKLHWQSMKQPHGKWGPDTPLSRRKPQTKPQKTVVR